jgi:hypothetical protein
MSEGQVVESENTIEFGRATRDPLESVESLGLGAKVSELEDRGYVIIEPDRVASPQFIERIKNAVLTIAEKRTGVAHSVDRNGDSGRYDSQPQQPGQFLLYYLLFEDRVFEEWIMNPTLQALISYLMRDQGRLSSLASFVKSKDGNYGEGLGLHADAPPGTTGALAVEHDDVCNAALVLTDYTLEDGAIAMVPGSHRYGRMPKPGEGVSEAVPVEAPAGSLIFWKGNTWHGAYPKLTDGLRLNVTSYVCHERIKTQENYQRKITRAMLERNTPAFAKFLGAGDAYGWGLEGPQFNAMARLTESSLAVPEEILELHP